MKKLQGRFALQTSLRSAPVLLVLGALTLASSPSLARQPFEHSSAKTTEVRFDHYEQTRSIVRERTFGRRAAVFSVEARKLDAPLLFEVVSVSAKGKAKRWSCLAIERTSECFAARIRVPYQANDQRIVLTVTPKPQSAPIVLAELERRRAIVAQNDETDLISR